MSARLDRAIQELVAALKDELEPERLPDGVDRLLTVDEAADLAGCGRSLMYSLIASGRVRSLKVGRLRRIPASAVAELTRGPT